MMPPRDTNVVLCTRFAYTKSEFACTRKCWNEWNNKTHYGWRRRKRSTKTEIICNAPLIKWRLALVHNIKMLILPIQIKINLRVVCFRNKAMSFRTSRWTNREQNVPWCGETTGVFRGDASNAIAIVRMCSCVLCVRPKCAGAIFLFADDFIIMAKVSRLSCLCWSSLAHFRLNASVAITITKPCAFEPSEFQLLFWCSPRSLHLRVGIFKCSVTFGSASNGETKTRERKKSTQFTPFSSAAPARSCFKCVHGTHFEIIFVAIA